VNLEVSRFRERFLTLVAFVRLNFGMFSLVNNKDTFPSKFIIASLKIACKIFFLIMCTLYMIIKMTFSCVRLGTFFTRKALFTSVGVIMMNVTGLVKIRLVTPFFIAYIFRLSLILYELLRSN
jgi:hypothetical protein